MKNNNSKLLGFSAIAVVLLLSTFLIALLPKGPKVISFDIEKTTSITLKKDEKVYIYAKSLEGKTPLYWNFYPAKPDAITYEKVDGKENIISLYAKDKFEEVTIEVADEHGNDFRSKLRYHEIIETISLNYEFIKF